VLFFILFFCLGGPKLLQLQNLGGYFVVFFLGGQNRNFGKVRGLKLQLSLYFNHIVLDFIKIILFNLKIKVDPNNFFKIYHD